MAGPLSGIRIIDMTTMMSGPLSTMLLGDQGAEVIKVESPEGEVMRKMGLEHSGMTSSFLCSNKSKRSFSVNVKTKKGLNILKELITESDVFVQNFRPGTAERIGLGEKELRKINNSIIYVSISGFGEKGPYSNQRVYDPVIQALSGLADIQKDSETGKPKMVRTVISDKTTALAASQAICAALYYREKTKIGQHIRLSMLDVMIYYLWPEGSSSLSFIGNELDPSQNQMGLDLVYKTKDRYITAGAVSDKEWLGMCKALDREDLINDKRFSNASVRMKNSNERRRITALEIAKYPSGDILKKLVAQDVPCAPILERKELLENDQVVINKIFKTHDSPSYGKIRSPRVAAIFSKTPCKSESLAPILGSDNKDILKELSYTDEQIRLLIKEGVIREKKIPSSHISRLATK